MKRLFTTGMMILAGVVSARAADMAVAPPSPPPASASSILSELRLGAFAHDPNSPEKGSVDINGEILFARPVLFSDPVTNLLVPRFHLGTTVNTVGRTSHVYAGFTWTVDLTRTIFVEGSLGGAIHNGNTGVVVPADTAALGCTALFRESASIGFRLTEKWSLMGTVEHLSNAGLCNNNRGLTNIGARLGYTF